MKVVETRVGKVLGYELFGLNMAQNGIEYRMQGFCILIFYYFTYFLPEVRIYLNTCTTKGYVQLSEHNYLACISGYLSVSVLKICSLCSLLFKNKTEKWEEEFGAEKKAT